MHGHKNIISMRNAGEMPKIVFINDWDCKTDWFENNDHATISTNGDNINRLDLRFLVGLTVSVSSETESRAKALFNACKQAGCKTVAAFHAKPNEISRNPTAWAEIWSA